MRVKPKNNLKSLMVCIVFVLVFPFVTNYTMAAVPVTLTHEGFLNWDIKVDVDLDDFEIVVESPNFQPRQTYDGPFGTPTVTPSGSNTKIHWSGATVPANTLFHVGLDMAGAGQMVSATATQGGNPVANVPIPFELTEIRYTGRSAAADVFMVFNTPQGFFDENPLATVTLENVRTFIDLPADLLDLPDLNSGLNLGLLPNETTPVPGSVQLFAPGNETEIYVGQTINASPLYESLLFGQVFVDYDGPGAMEPVMTSEFWNLNPQSPEPSSLVLLAVGAVVAIKRRR